MNHPNTSGEARHTPGPWHVCKPSARSLPHIKSADGIYVMDAPARNGKQHAKVRQLADARLIAAAPELLEALQLIVQWDAAGMALLDHHIARANAAIAKATKEGT